VRRGLCAQRIGDPVLVGVLSHLCVNFSAVKVGFYRNRARYRSQSCHNRCRTLRLACADILARMGHWVTIYDTRSHPGGALTYGFPNFKLPHALIDEIWNDLKQAG